MASVMLWECVMDIDRFNIVFTGELLKGLQIEVVKENFSKAFNISGMQLDALFQGKPVILKKNVDVDTGRQYQAQLKKFGMLSSLHALNVPQAATDKSAPSTPDDFYAPAEKIVEPLAASTAFSSDSDTGWSLAPAGSDMNQLDSSLPPVVVDISGISMAPVGSDILAEKKEFVVVDVDVSKFSLVDD